ncbi:hypothetical protein GCM10020001_056420 [Nonomuraea salmonea]
MAEVIQPSASSEPPKRSAVSSGNSALGMARTIAMMSTTNDISSTGLLAMKLSPSITDRSPGLVTTPSGGSAGSLSAA